MEKNFEDINSNLEKLEVLADIYLDYSKKTYPNKAQKDIAKLKMELTKKEMLLLNYIISKQIEKIK